MININLLPWRQRLIEQHRKTFWTKLSFLALFFFVLIYFTRYFFVNSLNWQQHKNIYLSEKISEQNIQLKKFAEKKRQSIALEQRLIFINQLQGERNYPTLLFNLLAERVPRDVSLKKLVMNKRKVQIEGIGASNQSLIQMLTIFQQDKRVRELKVHSIIQNSNSKESQFSATFELLLN